MSEYAEFVGNGDELMPKDELYKWIDKNIEYARNRNIRVRKISLSKNNVTILCEAERRHIRALYGIQIGATEITSYRGYPITPNSDLSDNIIVVSGQSR